MSYIFLDFVQRIGRLSVMLMLAANAFLLYGQPRVNVPTAAQPQNRLQEGMYSSHRRHSTMDSDSWRRSPQSSHSFFARRAGRVDLGTVRELDILGKVLYRRPVGSTWYWYDLSKEWRF